MAIATQASAATGAHVLGALCEPGAGKAGGPRLLNHLPSVISGASLDGRLKITSDLETVKKTSDLSCSSDVRLPSGGMPWPQASAPAQSMVSSALPLRS